MVFLKEEEELSGGVFTHIVPNDVLLVSFSVSFTESTQQ